MLEDVYFLRERERETHLSCAFLFRNSGNVNNNNIKTFSFPPQHCANDQYLSVYYVLMKIYFAIVASFKF